MDLRLVGVSLGGKRGWRFYLTAVPRSLLTTELADLTWTDAILLNVGFDAEQPMVPSPITVYGFDGLGQGYTFRSKLADVRWRNTSGAICLISSGVTNPRPLRKAWAREA